MSGEGGRGEGDKQKLYSKINLQLQFLKTHEEERTA